VPGRRRRGVGMDRKTNGRTRRPLVAKLVASTPILAVWRGPGEPHFTANQGSPPPLNVKVAAVCRNLEGRVSGVSTSARDPRPALRASTAGAQRVARERDKEQGTRPERSEQAGMAPYKGRVRDESTCHRVRLAVGKNSPPGRTMRGLSSAQGKGYLRKHYVPETTHIALCGFMPSYRSTWSEALIRARTCIACHQALSNPHRRHA
jgi:hypothetical protein